MDNYQKILELAARMGVVRPRDAVAEGIPRQYVQRLYEQGTLERISRGLYALPGGITSELASIAEAAKKVPKSVVCLLSALRVHSLTTQLPRRVWLAIPQSMKQPVIDYPPLRVVWLGEDAFRYGIEQHEINQVPVRVYSPAKTVADCFKFRNKIGLDVAIEALREARQKQVTTMDDLWAASKICRVSKVIRPYMEALT